MPSHLSTIGFPVNDVEDLRKLTIQLSGQAQKVPAKKGKYLRWTSNTGAEAWLQIDQSNTLIGINPHFAGASILSVRLEKRFPGKYLDGSFYAWMISDKNDEQEGFSKDGFYPFVFDVPDFQTYSDLKLPSLAQVQLSAFAHEIRIHESTQAFEASQTTKMKFASQSFIPCGLFKPDGQDTQAPEAFAIFTGHILQTELRVNEVTGMKFHWASVDTLGGVFDVLMDPELVQSPLLIGGVLSGTFWISGRLLKYERRQISFFDRLFGRS